MNKWNLSKNIAPILIFISSVVAFFANAFDIIEKFPPKIKPFIQLIAHALAFPVPIYSVLLGAAIGTFWYVNFAGKKEELSLEEIKDRIDIDLRSHGEQMHFSLTDSVPKVRIWLAISNMTPFQLTLESVSWEFWANQITKRGSEIKHDQVPSYSKNRDILLQADLIDSEVKLLMGSLRQTERKGNLSVTVSFHVGKEKIQKKASISDINYLISANVPINSPKEYDNKELFLLLTLANQHNKALTSQEMKNILTDKFKIAVSDFNIMLNDLVTDEMVYVATILDADLVEVESITITAEGLKLLKNTKYKV